MTSLAEDKRQIKIQAFKAFSKGTLRGFLDVELPSGMVLHGCTLHEKNSSRWIGLPARPYTGKENKTAWQPIVEFTTRERADKFRDQVLEAFDLYQGNQQREKGGF